MVKKKQRKDITDFYSENVNFSDDEESNFYAVNDNDESNIHKRKKSSQKMYLGFYLWELIIIIGEILLVIYLLLVLLGNVPLI